MAKPLGSPYVAEIKRSYKDKVYTTFLLRASYRKDGKVKQQTLANLSHLPREAIDAVRSVLRGVPVAPLDEAFEIVRTRAHGHVAAVSAMIRRLGLLDLISSTPCRERDLVEGLLVARVIRAQSKLASARWWSTTTLADDLDLHNVSDPELYGALDWLVARQDRIEKSLAKRHLAEDGLVLYDVSSSYYEGSHCPLAAFGHNRDKKKGKRQVVYGLITNGEGCPVAIEAFPGNTGDPATVSAQVHKLKNRFELKHVVLAGDRGMLTQAQIEKVKAAGGIDWVSALRAPSIQRLAEQGRIQLSLFDERGLAEIASPDFPGERLVVCRNPMLAEDRAKTRGELLAATEAKLAKVAARVESGRLKDQAKIGLAVGRVVNHFRMAKHFKLTIETGTFRYERNEASIRKEAALDGIYVVRTSVGADTWSADEVVEGYKSLKHAERAFRTFKSVDLEIRPIRHRLEDRVRAHIFLCFLAYYVEWHLRRVWKPLLFDDEEPGRHRNGSVVEPTVRSEGAKRKVADRVTENGLPVHSYQTLMVELGTVARNDVRPTGGSEPATFALYTTPTPLQREALEQVGINWDQHTVRRQNRTA